MYRDAADYFEQIAVDFDSYYDKPQGFFDSFINAWLRRPGLLKRLQIALEMTNLREGLRVLDVGCGSGKYVVECAKAGADVHGMDISPEMIRLAEAFCTQNNVRSNLWVGDATKKLPSGVDVVTALGVIEYFKNPHEVLAQMFEAVCPGGKVIFSVPKKFAFQMPLREIMLGARGIDCFYYTRSGIKNLVSKYNISALEIADYGPGYVCSSNFLERKNEPK
jgi:2-polyprenyl-3-methyl-5-hydroxy-6-metoxy-1,4-benzoquinol methylase